MGKLHIVSRGGESFIDRKEAGTLLANQLEAFIGQDTLVLGISSGGIIVGREIALRLGASLDIVLARKIGSPVNPEVAVGAVTESGEIFINNRIALRTSADNTYIQRGRDQQMGEINRRSELLRKVYPKIPLKDKVVIVTDDGAATKATMQAALWPLQQEHPKKLIVALPVSHQDTLEALTADADMLVCLRAPHFFNAVGQFYVYFNQVSDETVLMVLKGYKAYMESGTLT
jgi:predicted phosphoribosyltransferase